ncbi:DTW domain containing hypothetical protein 2 [Phytophthora palmivora]|uniref:Uncharacterized protein n=1 Tax=Phytophthora palmivora TaxID=4796 RepID=A0A2P4YPI4_9STRA|nr:DTW domain containing hypothetical protein 2 [Phytophthora palmivora]
MTKPGLMPLLPNSVQKVLLPAEDSDSDQEQEQELLDLKWTSGHTVPLLRYARQYLLRIGNAATPQISDQPANGGSVTLRTAASSVSVVMAALYVLRKFHR